MASWHKGREKELVLRAFDDYWGGWDGPHYKNVEYRAVANQNTAWQLLLRGEVSFVQRLNPSLFQRAKTTAGVRTLQVPSFQNMLVLFNTASGPLVDVRLRKAVQKAIDYDGVIAALKGAGAPRPAWSPKVCSVTFPACARARTWKVRRRFCRRPGTARAARSCGSRSRTPRATTTSSCSSRCSPTP